MQSTYVDMDTGELSQVYEAHRELLMFYGSIGTVVNGDTIFVSAK